MRPLNFVVVMVCADTTTKRKAQCAHVTLGTGSGARSSSLLSFFPRRAVEHCVFVLVSAATFAQMLCLLWNHLE